MEILSATPLEKNMGVNIQALILQIKKNVLKKYIDLRDGVKNETETMNDSKKGEYDKIL